MTTSITIRGYISAVDEKNITIDGCDYNAWKSIPSSYFAPGVRKRVSSNRKTCTVRITNTTTCLKGPKLEIVSIADLQSCYVSIMISIKKYRFHTKSGFIKGWSLIAKNVQTINKRA